MTYSAMNYLPPAWESAGPAGRINLRIADESDSSGVTINIRRDDGREVDIAVDLEEATVHDEWEFRVKDLIECVAINHWPEAERLHHERSQGKGQG